MICRFCGADLLPDSTSCGECGRAVAPATGVADLIFSSPDAAADLPEIELPEIEIPSTAVPEGAHAGTRFVLQFSTGESVTVTGAGLVGRNPSAQPGEFVDQFIAVFDAGKSVSKTHLEFGQEDGRFWVSDRFSTNGSIVRQPGLDPRRCEPGRRYFVMRGTRVDIGDQFFVVS